MVGGRGHARHPGGRPDGQADGRADGRTGRRTDGQAGWLIDGRPGKRIGGQDGLRPRRTDGRTDRQSRNAGPEEARRMQDNLKEDNSLIHSASGRPWSAWIRPSILVVD
jgi:hypothetical protein